MSEKREFVELLPTPELAPVGLRFKVERGYYRDAERSLAGCTYGTDDVLPTSTPGVNQVRVVTSVQEVQVATHFGRIVPVPETPVTGREIYPPVDSQKVEPSPGGVSGGPVVQKVEAQPTGDRPTNFAGGTDCKLP